MKKAVLIALVLLSSTSLSRSQIKDPAKSFQAKILFIGNSHLGYNNMTTIFKEFSDEAGKNVLIASAIQSGMSLAEHSEDMKTINKIKSEKWDCVVLQGGTMYLSKEKWFGYIKPYVKILNEMILNNNSETIIMYMMPWAYADGLAWMQGETDDWEQMQLNLYNNSIGFANQEKMVLAPVGWAWYKTIKKDPSVKLYKADMSHPTPAGSYLTACVFYCSIYNESAIPLNFRNGLSTKEASLYKKIATDVVLNDLNLWNIEGIQLSSNDEDQESLCGVKFNLYPNPVDDKAYINLSLTKPGQVKIILYNLLGEVQKIIHISFLEVGEHDIFFDCSDLSSGMYYVNIISEGKSKTTNLIVN